MNATGSNYDDSYANFDSPLMRKLRQEAYGQDIGQHSWVTAEELREDIGRLKLAHTDRLLDLGCGPCGPLTFVVATVGCRGVGTDVSGNAIAAGRARVTELGLDALVSLHQADLNEPIPLANGSCDTVMSLDVILHLRDRTEVFREVSRVLVPGGRFLFTDAGVITGAVSDEEMRLRAIHGHTQFVPSGINEKILDQTGLVLTYSEDRTQSLLKNAAGRLAARRTHREQIQQLEGNDSFERQQQYLETVVGLSQRGAVSRMMYLAQSRVA